MAPSLWLLPNVFMAGLHEDVVVLDIREDRYECLVGAAAWLRLTGDGRLIVPDEESARALVEAGLASEVPPPPRSPITAARRSLAPATAVSRPDQIRAALILMAAAASFRRRSLGALVAQTGPPVASSLPLDEDRLAALVGAARAAAPFVPFEGECLQRAYQLRSLLWKEGFLPRWIFGVRTWPFGAHCWLQVDDLVVGDTLDRVRFYTPIMAT